MVRASMRDAANEAGNTNAVEEDKLRYSFGQNVPGYSESVSSSQLDSGNPNEDLRKKTVLMQNAAFSLNEWRED